MASQTAAKSKSTGSNSPKGLNLALAAARLAVENNGRNVVVLDLRKQTPIFDYFVIVTGKSGRQLRAISDEIERVFKAEWGEKTMHLEGYRESRWIILDFGDVLVQLFTEEAREFYGLEDLWADGIRVETDAVRLPR